MKGSHTSRKHGVHLRAACQRACGPPRGGETNVSISGPMSSPPWASFCVAVASQGEEPSHVPALSGDTAVRARDAGPWGRTPPGPPSPPASPAARPPSSHQTCPWSQPAPYRLPLPPGAAPGSPWRSPVGARAREVALGRWANRSHQTHAPGLRPTPRLPSRPRAAIRWPTRWLDQVALPRRRGASDGVRQAT